MNTVKIGILGSGQIVRDAYAPILAAMRDVRLVAIAGGRGRANATSIATQFGIAQVCDDSQALLAREDLDAVVIAMPNVLHADLAIRALERGLHVLCEKPLAIDIAGARAAVDAARRQQRLLAVDLPLRVHPAGVELKRLCASGVLGELRSIRLRLYRRAGIPGWGSWFTRRRDAGAGALFDLGSHLCDLAVWLAGAPAAGSVACRLWADHGPRGRGLGDWSRPESGPQSEFDVDDRALVRWSSERGTDVEVDVAWAIGAADEMRFELRGADGGADLAPAIHGNECPLRVDAVASGGAVTFPTGLAFDDASTRAAWAALFGRFVAATRGAADVVASGAEVLVSQQLLADALDAAG